MTATTTSQGPSAGSPALGLGPSPEGDAYTRTSPFKTVLGLVGFVVTGYLMFNIFISFGRFPEVYLDSKLLIGAIAIVVGVGGAVTLFFFLNMLIEGLPEKLSLRLMPYAYLLPAFALIALLLLYPAVQTVIFSFANADSTAWVGFANYTDIFSDQAFLQTLFNNLLWLLIVPAVTVGLGIVIAVLADRLSARGESLAKSFIFLPMAISFVGASAIWGLIYDYSASGDQIGLLNSIWTTFGGSPQTWLQNQTLHLNSLLLMVIVVWLQAGFAMILLSSAIKGVPEDTIEAARIDGASEFQIFSRVVVPQIKGTTITVFITVLIITLKIFDIVYVLTNGRFNTNVIANLFFFELFASSDAGRASAIVVVLLVAITPVLIYQVRHFRREDAR